MRWQTLFSGENKKTSLSLADFFQSVLKLNYNPTIQYHPPLLQKQVNILRFIEVDMKACESLASAEFHSRKI